MILLASGERQLDQVIASWQGRRGTLFLTDRRLIFEYAEGLVSKKYNQLGISLGEVTAVNANHSYLRGGELVVTTTGLNNGFGSNTITFTLAMSPEVWIGKINNILSTYSSRSVQPTVVVEKEVVKIPCKYCNTLVDAFRNNTCPKCGAPIH